MPASEVVVSVELASICAALSRKGHAPLFAAQAKYASQALGELATKEFVRAEIAALRTELHKELGALRHDMGQLSWKMAGMLLLQAGLVVTLMKLL